MAIRLEESPEPLTGASGQQAAHLIESEGLRMLQQELRRYCDQKVSGRSFLVAGHRGSGKTTLVQGSIQSTIKEIATDWDNLELSRNRYSGLQVDDSATFLRPLFILLQGPNLLPADSPEAAAAKTPPPAAKAKPAPGTTPEAGPEVDPPEPGGTPEAKAAAAQDSTTDPPPNYMETVLIQITLGLYRALAGEFTRAYTDKAVKLARNDRVFANKRTRQLNRRSLELALQFELELDQYPGIAQLHEFWRLSDSLSRGVLFWDTGDPRMNPGQGYRELVALASTCQAYQRICGKLSRKDESSRGDKTKQERELAMDAKSSELLKPMMALLAGGAAGAGLLAASPGNAPLAVFTGIVTALLGSFAVKYTSSRTREQAANRADLFIPDLSVATLDRVLPVLLNRIRRAGLAPVFVVDELDKVDLTCRITEMVKRLKKLVAENAFFCFLTDRRYFEEMHGRTLDAPYPIEYTYFTNQLFIAFRHRDLHNYLDKVLEVPQVPSPSPSSAPSSPSSPPSSDARPDPAAAAAADDRDDKAVLQYILLHDSQMHAFDLRKQLGILRNPAGEIDIPRGEVRAQRWHYPFAISIQVAIELILDEEDMRAAIQKRLGFLQLAHDTLYYISRKWRDAPEPLDLSDDTGKKDFEEYLLGRKATNTSLGSDAGQPGAQPETPQQRLDKRHLKIDADICKLLFMELRQLATYLTADGGLSDKALESTTVPSVVIEALSPVPLLVPIEGQPRLYRWTHNDTGRPLDAETGAAKKPSLQPVAKAEWDADLKLISAFQHELSELTNREVDLAALASQYGILRTSPPWADARRAVDRLQANEGSDRPYPDQDSDLQCVRAFCRVLIDGAPAMGIALVCALIMRSLDRSHTGIPIFHSLSVLAEALRFRRLSPEGTLHELGNFIGQFGWPDGVPQPPPVSNESSVVSWGEWIKSTTEEYLKLAEPNFAALEKQAWDYWEGPLRSRIVRPALPGIGTVICHVLARGPGAYLRFPLEEMGIHEWTRTFVLALAHAQEPAGAFHGRLGYKPRLPDWMAIVALQYLGFNQNTLVRFVDYLRQLNPNLYFGELAQEGFSTDARPPAGMLIWRQVTSPALRWQMSPGQPMLICNVPTARELQDVLKAARVPSLVESLCLSFVAFDFSGYDARPELADPPAFVSAGAAPPSLKNLLLPDELTLHSFFAPDPKALILVLVDDPERYVATDQQTLLTGIHNPAELFAAVSALKRRAETS